MRKLGVPLYTETAFSVYKGTQYSHIRAHVKLGAWMGAGFNLECGLLFYFSITIWACALLCEFSVPYMWMLGALICEYWGWVSLYAEIGCPYIRAMGMPLYSGQIWFMKSWKTTHFPHIRACPYKRVNTVSTFYTDTHCFLVRLSSTEIMLTFGEP